MIKIEVDTISISFAEVDWKLCQGCQPCEAWQACKTRAIVKFSADELAFIEPERCYGCGRCVPACSHSAIKMMKNPLHSQPD
jgi:Fe-S-cluster-containing hydrogenase component 2